MVLDIITAAVDRPKLRYRLIPTVMHRIGIVILSLSVKIFVKCYVNFL